MDDGRAVVVDDDSKRWLRLGALVFAVVALVGVLALRSVLMTPTGEGVPTPRSACERGQSTAHTAGLTSWCER